MAKSYERRRCGHHPDEYHEPLSTMECLQSVVDHKDRGENKHRYVVASQSPEVRRMLRGVRGVPLIYIKRSVMILEPMSDETARTRAREEKSKFRAEIKTALGKRKREENAEVGDEGDNNALQTTQAAGGHESKAMEKPKGKKRRGQKGPNPLSVMKSKKKKAPSAAPQKRETPKVEATSDAPSKRKRRKKSGSNSTAMEHGKAVNPNAAVANSDGS